MHIKRITWIIFTIIILTSCSKSAPLISIACEENQVGNSIIKWEITPHKEGYVRVYAGSNPYNISQDIAVGMAKIEDQRIVIINNDPVNRPFYLVTFNNEDETVIGSRNINIPKVQNFRDLGGYRIYSHSVQNSIKWGEVFRTGNLDAIDCAGIARLKSLKIKTIVDLRPTSEQKKNDYLSDNFDLVSIPIYCKNTEELLTQIKENKVNRQKLKSQMRDIYTHLVRDNREQYKKVFDLLLDKDNYPIVFQCTTGKEQSGIASYLLMRLLGISETTAKIDYLRSNDFLQIPGSFEYAFNLSTNVQEALTALLRADNEYIEAAIQEINSSYGDLNNYLTEGLGISKDEINKLRSMLLEQ